MNPIYMILIVGVFAALLGLLRSFIVGRADKKPEAIHMDEEAQQRYAAICAPDEQLKIVCRAHYSKPWYYVLTSQRLIIDIPDKTHDEIRLSEITGIKAEDVHKNPYGGFNTTDPARCTMLTVWVGKKKYTMGRFSDKFTQLVRGIMGDEPADKPKRRSIYDMLDE